MAQTWQNRTADALPEPFTATQDGSRIQKTATTLQYTIAIASSHSLSLLVEATVGGKRHGLGFLVRLNSIDDIPLARPALIQARYFWSFDHNALMLAPGLPAQPPGSLEAALGLTLSPSFETQCLTCHGQPNTLGAGKQGGVHCETCHGPGEKHLQAVAAGTPRNGIVNPKNLSTGDSLAVCAQCHAGFGRHIDPTPADLLIANQVTALRHSECFIQTNQALTCSTCHNPHDNPASETRTAQQVCLRCHSLAIAQHAAICPINSTSDCIRCHMPAIEIGPLHLVDHWIRVHPEHGIPATHPDSNLQSRTPPLRAYLSEIATTDRNAAQDALNRFAHGESFYDTARQLSQSPSASIGGYLGEKILADLTPELARAAAFLHYGQTSAIISSGHRYVILKRHARDFRWQAEQLQKEAVALRENGQPQAAIQKSQEALRIYPQFLRALTFIGTTLAESGALERASAVLNLATRLYPDDAESLSALGFVLGQLGRHDEEIRSYEKAIELEPDFTAAYLNLGKAHGANQDWEHAAITFNRGLQIDPLSADLYENLSLAFAQTGDTDRAGRARMRAAKLRFEISQ
jgi:tetratricopeptide (TPR) repeat protein